MNVCHGFNSFIATAIHCWILLYHGLRDHMVLLLNTRYLCYKLLADT